MRFPHYSQLEYSDCGATCLKIILKFYKKDSSIAYLRNICQTTRAGVSMKDLLSAAKDLQFETLSLLCTTDWLSNNAMLPCIVHWKQEHFVVLYKIKHDNFYISDPAFGRIKLKREAFEGWWKDKNDKGITLLLEPTAEFSSLQLESTNAFDLFKRSFKFYRDTVRNQYKTLLSLFTAVAAGSFFIYLFPQTMQIIVDKGINTKNINILWSVFGFQIALILGQAIFNWVQGWLRVKLSMNVSIKIIKELLYKIIKLPIKYFDANVPTDVFQRIEDQKQVENFISNQLVQTFFSVIISIVLGVRLFYFNTTIGIVFTIFSSISVFWVFLFFKVRRQHDYTNFRLTSENHNMVNELITGMVEIKVNSAEIKKIDQWQVIQDKLFALKSKTLKLGVYQSFGIQFLTQFKNICITFIGAYWVIKGKLTLGEMLSIGYITGLLTNPIDSLANFSQSAQDAQLSLTRLDEILQRENEVQLGHQPFPDLKFNFIGIQNLTFKYEGGSSPDIIRDLNVKIPIGKITAIVGNSGSGKSTLIKLLLNFYEPTKGGIFLDGIDLKTVNPEEWRRQCGIVLQDGYIFSGTIADNIAIGESEPDLEKLWYAARVACIDDFISKLPMRFNTKIGNIGVGISGGQKQRLLIARAVYKNPQYIFLDEATSSLDSNNEKKIIKNLNEFFIGKTVLIIAHRLSTVKNADQILVLEEGRIVEAGNHNELTENRGSYYKLVKNQLELGN